MFMDVDRLRIGNWRKQIDQSLADCAAVIVVIGPQWLPLLEQRSTTDDQASDDQVRYEIAQALRLRQNLAGHILGTLSVHRGQFW